MKYWQDKKNPLTLTPFANAKQIPADVLQRATCSGSGGSFQVSVDMAAFGQGMQPIPSAAQCTIEAQCSASPDCQKALDDATKVIGIKCSGADLTFKFPGWKVSTATATTNGCAPCSNQAPPDPSPNNQATVCGAAKYVDPTFWGPKLFDSTLAKVNWAGIGNSVGGAFESAGGAVGDAMETMVNSVGNGVNSAFNTVGNGIGKGAKAVGNFFSGF